MSATRNAILVVAALAALALSACRPTQSSPTSTPPNPEEVLTAAAVTAFARLTENAAPQTPTPATPAASQTPSETPTPPAETATPSPAPTATTAGGFDAAAFVADVTIPDGTTFNAGESFVKTWRLKNVGSSTWTSDYNLVFYSGEQMSGPVAVPLTETVPPGETVDLSLALVAPDKPGLSRGYWILRNPAGELFGIGPNSDLPFYVEINVVGASGQGGTATATPFASGSGAVSAVSISAVPTSYQGNCPFTFTFNVQVTMASPARISLRLDAGAEDPSYTYNLPPTQSYDLGVGTYSFSYFLELSGSVNGWAVAHITAPEDLESNRANFTLDCQ